MNLKSLSDEALVVSSKSAAKTERESTTAVLHHLREVESRRLFVKYQCANLLEFAVTELSYSAPSAQRRIDAMRLMKVVPEIEEKIESGSLSLTTLSQAQKFFRQEAKTQVLAPEEKREVLAALEGKSTRAVDRELISRATEPMALRPESVRPISETHSEVKFTVSNETLAEMERVRGLLGHKHAQLSMGELFALLNKMALEKLDRAREPKRKTNTQRSQSVPAPEPTQTSRYIPAQVRRAVWKRAHGKCTHCGSLYRLQIDHIKPHAHGGSNQLENLRLLCFHCNQREADQKLGREKMETKRKQTHLPSKQTNLPIPLVQSLAGGAAAQNPAR